MGPADPFFIAMVYISLAAATLLSLSLFLYVFSRRHGIPGAREFAFFMLAVALYSFFYLLELRSSTLEEILTIIKVEYLGIASLPSLWAAFAIFYAFGLRRHSIGILAAMLALPALVVVVVATNEFHHLYYIAPSISTESGLSILRFGKGPMYWVFAGITTVSYLAGTIALFASIFRSKAQRKDQSLYILMAATIVWIAYIAYVLGYAPYDMDIVPMAWAISGPLYAIGVFKYNLFRYKPVARSVVFESMRDAVLVFDHSHKLVDFNPAALATIDGLDEDKRGLSPDEVFAGMRSVARKVRGFPLSPEPGERPSRTDEDELVHDDPSGRCFEIRIHPLATPRAKMGHAVTMIDMTERSRLIDRLNVLASTDDLTGIANRRSFFEFAHIEAERSWRSGHQLSVGLMDLDNFKMINDMHGHAAGDAVLTAVSRAVAGALRPYDLVGRYGGDEFALVLPGAGAADAIRTIARVKAVVQNLEISSAGRILTVRSSIGYATWTSADGKAPDIDELFALADAELYADKGRNDRKLPRE